MKAFILAAMLLFPSVGLAQDEQACLPYLDMITRLSTRFHEVPRQAGVLADLSHGQPRDGAIILTEAGEGQTWTILLIMPDGRACILAAGTDCTDRRPGI